MSRIFGLAAPLLVGAMCTGCGDDNRLSGGTSETENVVIAIDSVLPEWNRPGDRTTIATLRLTAARIDFPATDSLGRDIAVERLDGSPIPFEIVFWNKPGAQGRIRARIDTSLASPGSALRVSWNQAIARRSSPENTWAGISDSQRLAINSVLIDDFEDGDLRSLVTNRSRWSLDAYDSLLVDRSVVFDPSRNGSSMRLRCSSLVKGKGYALTQIALGAPRSLRSMDSVVFWARGPSKVAIAFSKNIPDLGVKAWKHVTLDSSWKRIVVTPTTFNRVDSIGGNFGWNVVRDSVTHLGFFVSEGTDLWIDDPRIHGIDRQDLE